MRITEKELENAIESGSKITPKKLRNIVEKRISEIKIESGFKDPRTWLFALLLIKVN